MMLLNAAARLLGNKPRQETGLAQSKHRLIEAPPTAVYAIGDVHGRLDKLVRLEEKIMRDSAGSIGKKLIVMLGDYLDRGPASAGVIDHLLAKAPDGFERICLKGNHEVMAVDFFERPDPRSQWLRFGGLETLQSYGMNPTAITRSGRQALQAIEAHVPQEHLNFLRSLDWTLSMPGWIFVHAGLRPNVPLDQQDPEDLFWIRDEFFEGPGVADAKVVHGHTPSAEPVVTPHRICIDTGAYADGPLTALKITPDGYFKLIQT